MTHTPSHPPPLTPSHPPQMWDLRYATAPMRTLERHKRGLLSLAWCPQDADLLLSAAKDNLVLCWNPNSEESGGEVSGEGGRGERVVGGRIMHTHRDMIM